LVGKGIGSWLRRKPNWGIIKGPEFWQFPKGKWLGFTNSKTSNLGIGSSFLIRKVNFLILLPKISPFKAKRFKLFPQIFGKIFTFFQRPKKRNGIFSKNRLRKGENPNGSLEDFFRGFRKELMPERGLGRALREDFFQPSKTGKGVPPFFLEPF